MDASISPTIAVIDYGMGNLRSVHNALRYVGAQIRIIDQPDQLGDAAGLILPGVGALRDCVSYLVKSGLGDTVRDWIADNRPFLGVCLGLQALFESSEEGDIQGLGIFAGKVVRFDVSTDLKVPHMGWNQASFTRQHAIMNAELSQGEDQFYFVHSYHVDTPDKDLVWATTDYGYAFTSAISRGNAFATQFHPERSQATGLQIYRNFTRLVTESVVIG